MTKETDLHPSAKTAHKNTSSIKKLFGLAVSTQDVAVQSENSIALYTARIFPDKENKINMSQDKNMSSSKDLSSNLTEENFCEDLIPECFKEFYKRQELATKCRPRPYEKIKISKTISKRLYPSFHELVNRHCSIPHFKKYCTSMDSYKKCPLTTISQQENKLHKYLHKQKSKPNLYCRYCCVCRHNASKNMHCLRLLCKTDSNVTASTSQVNKKGSKASLSMIQDKSTLRTNSKNQVAVSGEKVEAKTKKDDKQNSSLHKIHSCGSDHLRKRSANQFEASLNKTQKTKQSNEKNYSAKKKQSSTHVRKSSQSKKKTRSQSRSNSKVNKSQTTKNKDKLHTKSNTTLPITFIAHEPVIPCVKSISSINLLRINVKETSKLLNRKSDSAINFQHPDMMQKRKPSSKMKDLEGGSRNQLRTQQNNETATRRSASSQMKKQSETKISRSQSMNKLEQKKSQSTNGIAVIYGKRKKAQSNTSVCTNKSLSTDNTNKKRSSKNRHSSAQIRQKKKQSQDSASSAQSQSINNNNTKKRRSYNVKRSTEKLKGEGPNKTNKTQPRRSGTSVCSIRSQKSNDKVIRKYLDRDTPSTKKLTRTKIYKSSKTELSMSSTLQSKSNIGTSQSDKSIRSVGSANKSSSRVSLNTRHTSSTEGRKMSTTSISKSSTKRGSSRSKDRLRSKQKRQRRKFLIDGMECVCKPVKDRNKTRRRQKKLESKGLYYLYLEKKELQSTNCMKDKSTITDNPCQTQCLLETVDMNQCQAQSTKLPRMGFCPITYCLSKKDIKENYGCNALVPPFWVLFDNLITIIWSLYSNSESKQGLGESRTDTQLSQQYCPIKLGFGVSAQHEKGQRDVREANSHPHPNYRRGNNEKILRIKESSHDLAVRLEIVINRNLRAPNQFKFTSTVHTFKMNNVFVKIDIHFCCILITYNFLS